MSANGKPKSQVDLVTVDTYKGTNIPQQFLFTLKNGGALWEYNPMTGLVKGEDGSLWSVDGWLEEWVTYPTDSSTQAGKHVERVNAFHADLGAQR